MQRESPSFFLVIRNRQIYFFSPKKWKTDPLGPVIKEVQFTGSFSRPLADVARHRVSPGRTSIPRTLDRVSRLKIARSHNSTQRVRVRENFFEIKNRSHEKIYAEHRFHTSDICRWVTFGKFQTVLHLARQNLHTALEEGKNRFNFAHRH